MSVLSSGHVTARHAALPAALHPLTSLAYQPITAEHLVWLNTAFQEKRYDELSEKIIALLRLLAAPRIAPLAEQEKQMTSLFLRFLVMVFTDPDFRFKPREAMLLVSYASVIARARALCGLPNTNEMLPLLADMPHKLIELLALYSTFNSCEIDLAQIVNMIPEVTIFWRDVLLDRSIPYLDDQHLNRARYLMQHPALLAHTQMVIPDKDVIRPPLKCGNPLFFEVTYIDHRLDATLKSRLNDDIIHYYQQKCPWIPDLPDSPDFGTIVVISNFFRHNHPVYRSLAPFVYSLKGQYRLVFIYQEGAVADKGDKQADHRLFDEIHAVKSINELVERVHQINPGIIFYPDIGMTPYSYLASNLRLAPIQCTGYGHPVSSYSPTIDYFIASADAELMPQCQQHYSEKLVLIPGVAATPVAPPYTPTYPLLERNSVCISLAWGSHKIHWPFLLGLREIYQKTSHMLTLCLSGLRDDSLAHQTVVERMQEWFGGDAVRCYQELDQSRYYPIIEHCHFGIDSHYFGGYNRIIDSLHCGRPILTLEGERIYNRLGSQVLRQLGLSDLVAQSQEELIDKAVRLVEDHDYRETLSMRIRELDYLAILADHNPPDGYRRAFEVMIADYHAGTHGDKTPIIISD